jgi:hypothetical protein
MISVLIITVALLGGQPNATQAKYIAPDPEMTDASLIDSFA